MYDTLLLAVDVNDPEGAVRSAAAAVDYARHKTATLHILNVVPDDGMALVSSAFAGDHGAQIMADAEKALAAWAQGSVPEDVTSELHVTRGKVYDQVLKVAGTLNVDAIFVGAHSPALRDYLIGPNAARIARHATQSVFVIR